MSSGRGTLEAIGLTLDGHNFIMVAGTLESVYEQVKTARSKGEFVELSTVRNVPDESPNRTRGFDVFRIVGRTIVNPECISRIGWP